MNIPHFEMQDLFDWSTNELKRIDEAYPDVIGVLDGQGEQMRKLHFQEYNARLLALKEKYAIVSTTKSQTFNDVLQHA